MHVGIEKSFLARILNSINKISVGPWTWNLNFYSEGLFKSMAKNIFKEQHGNDFARLYFSHAANVSAAVGIKIIQIWRSAEREILAKLVISETTSEE